MRLSTLNYGLFVWDALDLSSRPFAEDVLSASSGLSELSLVNAARFFAAFARTAFTGESEKSMHHFWFGTE